MGAAFIVNGESEHAAQAAEQTVDAPLLKAVQEHFGIARGDELVRRKLAGEFGIVVDFAVVGDPNAAVFVGHGLMAGGREIDDREAPVTEDHAGVLEQAAIVGTAMRFGRCHTLDGAALRRADISGGAKEACDAAHKSRASRWRG